MPLLKFAEFVSVTKNCLFCKKPRTSALNTVDGLFLKCFMINSLYISRH